MRIDYDHELGPKGRNEDVYMAHVAQGEMIVPPVISDETRARLHAELLAAGLSPDQFTVGDGMSINPETGLPEFGFGKSISKGFKKIKKVVKKVVKSPLGQIGIPLALSVFAPGFGTAIGTSLGASGAMASGVGSGIIGAGLGAASGGLKGALTGGALGGLGGYAGAGGFGSAAGTSLDTVKGVSGLQGPTMGTGTLGKLTSSTGLGGSLARGAANVAGLSGAGTGGGSSLFGGNLSSLLSGAQAYNAQDDMEDDMLEAQRKSEKLYAPWLSTGMGANNQLSANLQGGFDASELQNDPGYQFNLSQGQKALDRVSASRGSYFSGQALKDAAEYGQGLADNTYNAAYQRWLAKNNQLSDLSGQGYNAAQNTAGLYDAMGDIKANATGAKSNTLTSTLSTLLSGSGARRIIGYQNGRPIYDEEYA